MSKSWSSRGILFEYIEFSCGSSCRVAIGSKADLIPDRLRSCEPRLKCLLSEAEEVSLLSKLEMIVGGGQGDGAVCVGDLHRTHVLDCDNLMPGYSGRF